MYFSSMSESFMSLLEKLLFKRADLAPPSSLMANAARKARDSGEKKVVARDIRKVTMVRKRI
jgi:hypothetical protein